MKLPFVIKDRSVQANFDALARVVDETWLYDEVNGGADVAIPNNNVWQNVVHASGSPVGFTLTVPAGVPNQLWSLQGSVLLRADSANDTPLKGGILINGAEYAIGHVQRAYTGGTLNLQGWSLATMSRLVTLVPGSYTVRLMAIAYAGLGGAYHRGDARNGGTLLARRVK